MQAITDQSTLESELADLAARMDIAMDTPADSYATPSTPDSLGIKEHLQETETRRKKFPGRIPEDYLDRAPRHVAHWKIAVVYDEGAGEKEIYYGKTYEVSLTGASFLSDHNVFLEGDVHILLALPFYRGKKKEIIIEIKGRMVYTILSHEGHQFRTGLQFLNFRKDEVQYLDRALQTRRRVEKSEKYFSMAL